MSAQTARILDDSVSQWVVFNLAGETYGIDVVQVQGVRRHMDIAPVPGAPDYILGIINLGGNMVTVIDTRQRFGLPVGEITHSTRIVIVEADHHVVGMLVDSVAEIVYLRQSDIESAPNAGHEESARFVQGICNRNGRPLILVELGKMLTEDEWAELDHL